MKISQNSIVTRLEQIAEAEVEGDMVVMNLDTGSYVGLTGTGMQIWNLLQTSSNFGEIVSSLVTRYRVDHALCLKETAAFCEQLQDAGIVSVTKGKDV